MTRYEQCPACKGNRYQHCSRCACKACARTGKTRCTACSNGYVKCAQCKGSGWTGETTPCAICNSAAGARLKNARIPVPGMLGLFALGLIVGWAFIHFLVGVVAGGLLALLVNQSKISAEVAKLRKENIGSGKVKCTLCGGTERQTCQECLGKCRIGTCDECGATGRVKCTWCSETGKIVSQSFVNFQRSLSDMSLDRLKHEYHKRNNKIHGIRHEITRLEEEEREDREFYEGEVGAGRRGGKAGDWPSSLEWNPQKVRELENEIADIAEEMTLIDNEMGKKWS